MSSTGSLFARGNVGEEGRAIEDESEEREKRRR